MPYDNIISREDGSYIITRNGNPFHVPDNEEFAELWQEVRACALAYPGRVRDEVLPQPPTPDLEEARSMKLAALMQAYNAAFAPIEEKYPAREREGWAVQEAEARAVLADPQAATPVLSLLVQLRNKDESVPELAALVLDNALRWRSVYALLTGAQQRMYAEIVALASVEKIMSYPITFQLPEGM